MSEFLYGTGPTWTPDEKSYRRCAESTCHPDKILHFCAPLILVALVVDESWMRGGAIMFFGK
jgi:hypothetical protein